MITNQLGNPALFIMPVSFGEWAISGQSWEFGSVPAAVADCGAAVSDDAGKVPGSLSKEGVKGNSSVATQNPAHAPWQRINARWNLEL